MKTLNVICGVCILFTTLVYAHMVHHVITHNSPLNGLGIWAGIVAAIGAGTMALVGAVLLLRNRRM